MENEEFFEKLLDYTEEYRINIPFVNKSNNPNPSFGRLGDSCMDIAAHLDEPIILEPMERCLIPTGLYFDLPTNLEIQVRPRSGLAINYGITVLNSPGTVDSNYTGEIKVILINLSKEPFKICNGDRIAQIVINSVPYDSNLINFDKVDKIEKTTERNEKGFGSSGLK